MFQFLIGRLKTMARLAGWKEDEEFQFLIGRLKTVCGKYRIDLEKGFNSS